MLYNGNYFQFTSDNVDVLGSDGVSPFDARLSKDSLKYEGLKRVASMKKIKSSINGFKIYKKGVLIYYTISHI